jgi:hypothetical protein
MHKNLYTLLVLFVLGSSQPAFAQAGTSEVSVLARAIHRIKTGERGNLHWRECGRSLSADEALVRANEYATYLFAEREADPGFSPWIGAAIAMQESSFNRCAISRDASRAFATRFEEEYDREPIEADYIRFLRNRAWRSRMGVTSAFDAGLVQFRWPGTVATLVGMTDAGTLVEAQTSIRMLALSLQRYRTTCDTVREFRGVHSVNRGDGTVRVVRYSIPCLDGYWVQHNSPASFNYRYYRNVMRRHEDLVRLSAPPEPSPEEDAT